MIAPCRREINRLVTSDQLSEVSIFTLSLKMGTKTCGGKGFQPSESTWWAMS